MSIRNNLLKGIVAAVGGTVTDPVTRNSLLQDWLDSLAIPPSFSPLDLFAQGEQGAWYDPSDLSTLFQDAAGTIPVTADGDPVGYMGDKSGNGNHATQSVSASRPLYQVGDSRGTVNKILNSQHLSPWTGTRKSISSDVIAAPDNSMTADKLIEDTSDNSHVLYVPNAQHIANEPLTISLYAKAAERNVFTLTNANFANFGNVWGYVIFDLTAGTVVASGGTFTGSIEDVGDGWYRCSLTATPVNTVYTTPFHIKMSDGTVSQNPTYLGDGISGFYIWGCQVEAGSTATAYQRNDGHLGGVGTGSPTDLHWLAADGIDDSMITSNFGLSQPTQIFMGVVNNDHNHFLIDGTDSNTGSLYLNGTPDSNIRMGTTAFFSANENLPIRQPAVIKALLSGVNSSIGYDNNTSAVGDAGLSNMGLVRIFEAGNGSYDAHADMYGLVIINRALTNEEHSTLMEYIALKSGVTL